MSITYTIYSGAGGAPVDYQSAVATAMGTAWTSSATLPAGQTTRFGVRASDANGEEANLDAVSITLDASGRDISGRPMAPVGLRAIPQASGALRVEWHAPPSVGPVPTGFHVYSGTGGSPSYAIPVATVAYATGLQGLWTATLSALTDGTAYAIGVRAYNAAGEETNTSTVTATADATGPLAVESLSSSVTV